MPHPAEPPWSPLLTGAAARAALDAVAALTGRPRPAPRRVRPDLAAGGPGLALVFHQWGLVHPGAGWAEPARGYLAASAAGDRRLSGGGPPSPGLFGGLAGLAFAAWLADPGGHLLAEAHERVVRRTADRVRELADPSPRSPDLRVSGPAVDLVTGLTGSGAYLLCRAEDPGARSVLEALLRALVLWAELPPTGGLDRGMAHGAGGPLALLALAARAGVTVPGQRPATARLAERILAPDAPGPDRPGPPPSWCRGGPGTARALWLAGVALDDPGLREQAVRLLKGALHQPTPGHRPADAPGLCHGRAGLLQITLRFARDTGDPQLAHEAVRLAAPLAAGGPHPGGAGFLDGAAGTALALLAAATADRPVWDRALLLS
ncbi:lanthionine synthetase LanC family protein [Streptomyces sp. NPDC089919]|uniref:lanthionine synthetase LanC family protein n=1 Tax=Streptomyces sp. NPDC089919 TaxID=3155188 RepID=UPI0034465506